jgi:CBS domain-containing protein
MTTTLHPGRDLGSPGRLNRRPIVEVMTVPAPIIADNVPLVDAIASMLRLGVRHAAVVDKHGRCLGVLDERAAACRWSIDRMITPRHAVASVLAAVPAVIPANAVVMQAARFMLTAGVDGLAVIDARGRPVGIVAESDLIALLSESR